VEFVAAAALLYQLLPLLLLLLLQSVQHVMGQVTALAWALKLDPNLFTAGPEVLHAAKDAFTLAEREETLLLHKLVRLKPSAPFALCLSFAPRVHSRCAAPGRPVEGASTFKALCQPGLLDMCKRSSQHVVACTLC
jgi:hypothetical protein